MIIVTVVMVYAPINYLHYVCVCDVGMFTCGCNNFKAIITLERFNFKVSDN